MEISCERRKHRTIEQGGRWNQEYFDDYIWPNYLKYNAHLIKQEAEIAKKPEELKYKSPVCFINGMQKREAVWKELVEYLRGDNVKKSVNVKQQQQQQQEADKISKNVTAVVDKTSLLQFQLVGPWIDNLNNWYYFQHCEEGSITTVMVMSEDFAYSWNLCGVVVKQFTPVEDNQIASSPNSSAAADSSIVASNELVFQMALVPYGKPFSQRTFQHFNVSLSIKHCNADQKEEVKIKYTCSGLPRPQQQNESGAEEDNTLLSLVKLMDQATVLVKPNK